MFEFQGKKIVLNEDGDYVEVDENPSKETS